MTRFTTVRAAAILIVILFLASCSNSVTNVWDYYVKNNVEAHQVAGISSSKSKILYREQEDVNKAQLELIAFKQDSVKYLVIGSHKVAKAFYIQDSLYYFDVNSLYSRVRGNDFIRQMGDLTIFFAHIPADKCAELHTKLTELKSKYSAARPAEGETIYIDYAVTHNVFVSMEKTSRSNPQQVEECALWVGKRKHIIGIEALMKALSDLKAYN